METILLAIHVLLSLTIIGLVLIQRGKGADAGAALGGGGGGASGSVFGARGAANFLSRTTAVLATGFFVSSLTLAYMASGPKGPTSVTESAVTESVESSVLDDVPVAEDVAPVSAESDVPVAEDAVPASNQSDLPAAD